MGRHVCVVAMIGLTALSATGAWAEGAIRPSNLRCEYRRNPLGIDVRAPRLSWVLESNRRNARQTAYQVLVADDEPDIKANHADLWDSGKVMSDRSNQIAYAGKPLNSRRRAFWKVRVWDQNGSVSAWSAPARWEMGLLESDDWKGSWIGLPKKEGRTDLSGIQWLWLRDASARDPEVGVRIFRAALDVPAGRKVKSAQIMVLADNQFEAYLGRKKVASGSGWQQFTTAEVGESIKPGANVITIGVNNTDGPGGMAALVQATLDDGTTLRLPTGGAAWKATARPPQDLEKPNVWTEPLVLGELGIGPWGKPGVATQNGPAPYLRKGFTVASPIKRARLYASALGLYQITLNGQRVGHDILTPGWTDYRKRVQYQTYDVTNLVKAGDNAIGMTLGDGWYCGHVGLTGGQNYGPSPRGYAQLEIETEDGKRQTLVSDAAWKAASGPILSDDLLMGETYDARREMPGWSAPGFDDSKWQHPTAEQRVILMPLSGPVSIGNRVGGPYPITLVASCTDPVQKILEIKSKTLTEKPQGAFIFDLGQNMVGWARLKVKGPAGTTVRLRFAEMLNPDGSIYTTNLRGAKATDYYTLKGGGEEIYEPTFTFHGFRYVELTGYPGTPGKDAVTGVVVSSAIEQTGTFACSNPMVNQLQSNIVWGQRGNYLEVPTDCPQRDERLGWMGDAQVFIRTACANFNVAPFITKWIQDVVDAQSPSGGFSDVSPRMGDLSDGAPAWGDAGVIVPWTVYLCYGDTRLIEKHYDAMAKWIEYIDSANPNHLWIKRSNNNFGDWLNHDADMPRDVLATAYFAYSTRLLSRMARVIGKTEDAEKYERLFQEIKAAFNEAYVRPDGHIKGDTQSCYLVALRFDLLPEDLRPKVTKLLVTDIMETRKGHLSTGFVGVGYLNPTLSQSGHTDVAYRLLNNDTYPSWGYSIRQGATTIWERWDGWTKEKGFQDPGMNSFNHYSLGSVGEWLFHTVAGIDLDPAQPGYRHLILHPEPGGGMTFAKATYDSIQGRIVSDWKIENGAFVWNVTIPANTMATVTIPTKQADRVLESGKPAGKAEGVTFVKQTEAGAVYQIGSGSYRFTAPQ